LSPHDTTVVIATESLGGHLRLSRVCGLGGGLQFDARSSAVNSAAIRRAGRRCAGGLRAEVGHVLASPRAGPCGPSIPGPVPRPTGAPPQGSPRD